VVFLEKAEDRQFITDRNDLKILDGGGWDLFGGEIVISAGWLRIAFSIAAYSCRGVIRALCAWSAMESRILGSHGSRLGMWRMAVGP
jgi:hypothetical protein